MGTDALESMGQDLSFGNNSYICITPDSRDDADRLFNSLSDGVKVETPMADMPGGGYFACGSDKFGMQRMVHFDSGGGNGNGSGD